MHPMRLAQQARQASLALSSLSAPQRSRALMVAAHSLMRHRRAIIAASASDVARARGKVSPAFLDRLALDEERFHEMVNAVEDIARQRDPLGHIIESKKIKNGVTLKKITVPIGVLLVIYEARPHVTADAAALALRAGNAVILKGGSEALGANRLIARCFRRALRDTRLPPHAVQFIDTADRRVIKKLLKLPDTIDLVIPRGGYGLVTWVRKESEIPSLSHAEGLDHTYVAASADIPLALKVIVNAKTSFPAGCNALDHLLVHARIARKLLPSLQDALRPYRVELRGDASARRIINIKAAIARDWDTEYLGLKMGIKIVRNVEEAVAHINAHGSKHSEGVIARDHKTIRVFQDKVDAAAIFVNCS
ncbi:MAG: glutamate-5-semialdehyde dehydrogenase, partial [Pseudomonadales bacterium RIFCSPHIGHO2_02_FULL_60_43]